jgi:hypothetical protein
MGQQLQGFHCALLECADATLYFRIQHLGVVDVLHARHRKSIALQEFGDLKPAQPADDRLVGSIRCSEITQHGGARADPVNVIRPGLGNIGLGLQQDTDRPFHAHRFLQRRE